MSDAERTPQRFNESPALRDDQRGLAGPRELVHGGRESFIGEYRWQLSIRHDILVVSLAIRRGPGRSPLGVLYIKADVGYFWYRTAIYLFAVFLIILMAASIFGELRGSSAVAEVVDCPQCR